LFLGPEGCGKIALAIAYAQYINCNNRTEQDSCGTCPSCIQFSQLAHPDLHFLYPINTTKALKKPVSKDFIHKWREYILETDYFPVLTGWYEKIGIEKKQGVIRADDARETIKALGFKSYESEYKIMVIWMAEKLHHTVAPRFLKILEEPPDKTLFLLIAEAQEQIIPTVLSRTQIIKVPGIEDQVLHETLIARMGCSEEEAGNAVNIAHGNYIRARTYVQDTGAYSANMILFRDWMRLCFRKDFKGLDKFISKASGMTRDELKDFFQYALGVVRNELMIHYENEPLLRTSADENEFLSNFSPFMNSVNIQHFNDVFNHAYHSIERNANASITLMDLSLKAIRLMAMKPVGKAG
jgi:DNA polymerase-3 subunit delta'